MKLPWNADALVRWLMPWINWTWTRIVPCPLMKGNVVRVEWPLFHSIHSDGSSEFKQAVTSLAHALGLPPHEDTFVVLKVKTGPKTLVWDLSAFLQAISHLIQRRFSAFALEEARSSAKDERIHDKGLLDRFPLGFSTGGLKASAICLSTRHWHALHPCRCGIGQGSNNLTPPVRCWSARTAKQDQPAFGFCPKLHSRPKG